MLLNTNAEENENERGMVLAKWIKFCKDFYLPKVQWHIFQTCQWENDVEIITVLPRDNL